MGFMSYLFYPWGLILQGLAIVHFIRRRPDTYWIWVILLLGPIGAIVYLFAEAIPDLGLLRGSLKVFPRRKRIRELKGWCAPTPRRAILRNSATSTWTTANSPRPVPRLIARSPPAPIRSIRFTAAASAPYFCTTPPLRSPTSNASLRKSLATTSPRRRSARPRLRADWTKR